MTSPAETSPAEKSPADKNDLDWLLNDLVERVRGADRVVMLSADGLLMARSKNLVKPDAEHLAAAASAFHSLARGTGRHFGGGDVYQTVVEMQNGYLLISAAGRNACLALLTTVEADLGMIAYEMNMLVIKMGRHLATMSRSEPAEKKTA